MYFSKLNVLRVLAFLVSMGLVSCVKDVDFDQAGNISLNPEIQTDLVIFDVNEKDFFDQQTSLQKKILRDTVRLEFLDDSYIQDNLQSVEFSFRYNNNFTQSFSNKISFLSENNQEQHSVSFYIGAGNDQNTAVTEKVELIELEQIDVIKRSIKMVVEIEVLPNQEPFVGKLRFESKGLFSFEF